MTDIERLVARSLRALDEREVRVDALRDGAIARAERTRRRRTFGSVAAAGVATAVAVTGAVLPRLAPGTERAPDGSVAVVAAPLASLPVAGGAPSALGDPRVVGADPGVLHFDVDLAALGATGADWSTAPGYEAVAVSLGSGGSTVEVYLGTDAKRLDEVRRPPGDVRWMPGSLDGSYGEPAPQPTVVNGRRGTAQTVVTHGGRDGSLIRTPIPADRSSMPEWAQPPGAPATGAQRFQPEGVDRTLVLRWQPAGGLWGVIQYRGTDPATAYRAAGAIRLDRARRCAVPLSLDRTPTGWSWTGCRTALRRAPDGRTEWSRSTLTFSGHRGGHLRVALQRDRGEAFDPTPDRTIAGYPAAWRPEGLWVPRFGPAAMLVANPDEELCRRLVQRVELAGDLTRPETWPAGPAR